MVVIGGLRRYAVLNSLGMQPNINESLVLG
jgi:hypothetical protein